MKNSSSILVFAPHITPRVKYIFKLILDELLGLEILYSSDKTDLETASIPVVNYSDQPSTFFQVCPYGLLFHKEIFEQTIVTFPYAGSLAFFKTNGGDLPFDLFSASFYLVSRYEEYLPHITDEHGRYKAENSLVHKLGLLRTPLVNIWVEKLAQHLLEKYPDLVLRRTTFSFVSTVDVDNAYAYLGKGIFRTVGAIGKDISSFQFARLNRRVQCLLGLKKDPYDTIDYQKGLIEKYGLESIHFMLFAPFGENDRNLSPQSHLFKSYIKGVNDHSKVGLHPSYQSHQSKERLVSEKVGLEKVVNQKVLLSRQHYLKMRLPQTFRQLSALGITDEYSMGYASEPGFRASICHSFNFYDLELELELPLRVHPLVMMDVTYIYYKKWQPEKALLDILELLEEIKRFNGEFVSVWHNRTFSEEQSEWIGWNRVYESILEAACRT